MDFARRAAISKTVSRLSALVFFLVLSVPSIAQSNAPTIKELSDSQQWQAIIQRVEKDSLPTPDSEFYYGAALAHLEMWDKASQAFLRGQQMSPKDERFPVELAGVAFKQKHYEKAVKNLHRALQLNPSDDYANDFLGTVFFLQGNLEGSLKYWNRVGKPHVSQISYDPTPKLDPVLLDHTFAFSQESTLRLEQLQDSAERIRALGIFPDFKFDLSAQPDGNFSLVFRNHEKRGWRENKWTSLFMLLRGLPAQTIYPEVFNIGNQALNFTSSYRWDAQKRRIQASISGPLAKDPKRGFTVGVDLRNENWAMLSSFTGPATMLGGFNIRREGVYAKYANLPGARFHWYANTEISHRDFRSEVSGPALTPSLLSKGYQLKEEIDVQSLLWSEPDRRMRMDVDANSQTGRLWSSPSQAFEKLRATAQYHWLPLPTGDDYSLQARVSAGKTFGSVPFDELWMLGIGGDNDLWMRGHIATRDGRKGSGPLGSDYFLSNIEINKNLYQWQMVRFIASPFVDTGTIRDDVPGLGSHKWLTDVGASLKLKAFGFGAALSYGKDLRSGNNAIYITLLR